MLILQWICDSPIPCNTIPYYTAYVLSVAHKRDTVIGAFDILQYLLYLLLI